MSFVQQLRMRNMFPINSDMGSARINLGGGDPMREVINEFNRQLERRKSQSMSGLQRMTTANAPQATVREGMSPSLQFGGVVGGDTGPGTEILARARQNAERIYQGYKQPLNQEYNRSVTPDEIHMQEYFNRKNEETRADATRIAAEGNAAYKEGQGWKTVTVTDPNDPSKQINVRLNEKTGETKPIELPGVITRTGSAKDLQGQLDAEAKGAANRKAGIERANQSLAVIKDLMDDKGNLTTEGARAVGKSSIGNFIPTTKGYSGSKKINQLRSEQVLSLIKDLKEQSRTGATGMGNMSNKDLGVIEKAASLLDTELDEEEFKKQLGIVKSELQDIVTRLNATPDRNTKTPQSGQGKIRVRDKATGKTGYMSEGAFNAQKYDRL